MSLLAMAFDQPSLQTILKTICLYWLCVHTYEKQTLLLNVLYYISLKRFRARAPVQWLNLSAWKIEDRGFEPHSGIQVSKIQYCGVPPWPTGSVLGLRPPGLEFQVLCLEGSVISFISPSLGGFPVPVFKFCRIYAERWPKTHSFHLL